MPEPALVADDLRKRYGDASALRGVSLSVAPGDVYALVGPNGAGKTTLVRCLSGTTDPTGGTAALLGTPPAEAERARLGLLPQDYSPPERLTARELVGYFAGLYDEARPTETVLESVGMTGAADTRYANLSGGEKRRTLVGTALVNDPDVLFLDEPTTGIDPAGRRDVWALIEELAGTGATVLLTSHDMAEVSRLADRVGVLVDGRLVADDVPSALLAAHGDESRLVVETDGAPDVGERLAGHPVAPTDRGLRIDDVDPDDIGEIVDALSAAGVEFEALTWREPDLETVYLELAGEEVDARPGAAGSAVEGDAG